MTQDEKQKDFRHMKTGQQVIRRNKILFVFK